MNLRRRSVIVGVCALTAGCLDSTNTNPVIDVQSTERLAPTDSGDVRRDAEESDSEVVIVERPDENTVFVYRELQLPDPSHEAAHEVNVSDDRTRVRVTFTSESHASDDEVVNPVIEPEPYWVALNVAEIVQGVELEVETIQGDTYVYELTGSDSVANIK